MRIIGFNRDHQRAIDALLDTLKRANVDRSQSGSSIVADDKTKRGKPDRVKVSRSEPYELDYVAKKLGVKREDVRNAQEKVGPSRDAVEKELKRILKKP